MVDFCQRALDGLGMPAEFDCRKCYGNIGEAVEQEETLCNEVEAVSGFK